MLGARIVQEMGKHLKQPERAYYGAALYIIIRDIISAAVVQQQVYRTVTSRRDLNRRPCTRYITKTFDFDISRSPLSIQRAHAYSA